jgi:hypothetical protein
VIIRLRVIGSKVTAGHTRLSFRVMSVRRAGLSVTGDKREEVERRAGRNILPERKDMMEVWIGSSGPASAIVNLAPLPHYKCPSCKCLFIYITIHSYIHFCLLCSFSRTHRGMLRSRSLFSHVRVDRKRERRRDTADALSGFSQRTTH